MGSRTVVSAKKLAAREKYLLHNFKLTLEKWQRIFDYQGGLCAICKSHLKKANVDHDHGSGECRGLLCPRCNRALGRFGDSLVLLKAAVEYLVSPPVRVALGAPHYGYSGRIGTKKHRKLVRKEKEMLTQTRHLMEGISNV